MTTLTLGTFPISQQYLGLLPIRGSYTVKVSLKNANAGKKDAMQEKITNYKLITNLF